MREFDARDVEEIRTVVDTGAGRLLLYVAEGALSIEPENAARLILSPSHFNEITITLDGIEVEPRDGELCHYCENLAMKVTVWRETGRIGECEQDHRDIAPPASITTRPVP